MTKTECRAFQILLGIAVRPPGLRRFRLQSGADQGDRARQPRRRGVQEQPLRLGREGFQAGDPDRPVVRDRLLQPGQGLPEAAEVGQGDRVLRAGRPAEAGQRQLPVRPGRGLLRVEEARPGAEGVPGRDRRRPEAVQGLVASRPGLQDPRPPEGGGRCASPRHRGQPALLEVVRRARLPLPRLRLQQGSGSGVPGLRDGQGRRRRVPQRLRAGAQEPQAVRAGDERVQEGDRPRSASSTTRSTTPAWRTPTGSTRPTATTRRTRRASTCRSSSPTRPRPPTATT